MQKCPKCSHEVDDDLMKCPDCGWELPGTQFSGPIITNSPRGGGLTDPLGPYKAYAAWRYLGNTWFGKAFSVIAVLIVIILIVVRFFL